MSPRPKPQREGAPAPKAMKVVPLDDDVYAVVEIFDTGPDAAMHSLWTGTLESCNAFLRGMTHMAYRIKREVGWSPDSDGLEDEYDHEHFDHPPKGTFF